MSSCNAKRRSVKAINLALEEYRGQAFVVPPRNKIYFGEYHKISREQSDQGVIGLVHACNLAGGSVGDVDLYKLVWCYLQDHSIRTSINAILNVN